MSFESFHFPSSSSRAIDDEEPIGTTLTELFHSLQSPDISVRVRVLRRLRKITIQESNRALLVAAESGLIPHLVDSLETANEECGEHILRILLDLSSPKSAQGGLAATNPHIFRSMLNVLRRDDPVNQQVALEILSNLSADESNILSMTASPLGLLPILFEIIHFQPGEARMAALSVLLRLAESVPIHRQHPLEVADMVSSNVYSAEIIFKFDAIISRSPWLFL